MAEQRSNVVLLNNASPMLRSEINTALLNLLHTHLYPTLPASITSLIEFLSNQVESATSNSQIMRFMEVIQKLKQSQHLLIKTYSKHLNENFIEWEHPIEKSGEDILEENLCLVDNSILEVKLAWYAAAKQLSMCEEFQHLYNFESRLDELMVVDPELNPIGAMKICESFSDTLSTLDLELDMLKEVLPQFAKSIMPAVANIWKEADDYLAHMGLELKTPKVSTYQSEEETSEGSESTTSTRSPNTDSTRENNSDLVNSIAQQIVARVESLLNSSSSSSAHNAEDDTTSNIHFAAVDLAYSLTSIQDELAGQHASIFNLSESIQNALKTRGVKKELSARHEDLINMVGLLFEYIIDNHELPEEVKKLIGLLQIPVLKLALLEQEFLSTESIQVGCFSML